MPVCGFTDCGQTEVAIMGYAGGETGDGGSGVLLPRAASSRWLARFGNSQRVLVAPCFRGRFFLLPKNSENVAAFPEFLCPPHLLG